MVKKKSIQDITTELLKPILEPKNYELVDVEFVKEGSNWFLKIYIDKEGGITIDDCEFVSRAIEKELDEADPIPQAYILEVSSPGLDRPLKKKRDFERNIGKLVEVKLFKPLEESEVAFSGTKEFNATLVDFVDNQVILKDENDKEVSIDKKAIAIIRLAIIF